MEGRSGRPFLNSQETYEHYENRSRPTSSTFSNQIITENVYPAKAYQQEPPLACEYRSNPRPTVTAYYPQSNKKKIPVGFIVAVAIAVPVIIIICMFGAVWLQELGIL